MSKKTPDLSTWPVDGSPYLTQQGGLNMNPIAKAMSRDKGIISERLSDKHMLETLERFKWKLPTEIPQDILERVLYFRFKGAFFRYNERFYFLPFTLKTDIDSYGRYNDITPVLFTGQWKADGDEDIEFMSDLTYPVAYDKLKEKGTDYAITLTSSSLAISQDKKPEAHTIKPWIEQLTDILVLTNMDLITSAKVFYIVAADAEQKLSIEKELGDLDSRILNGIRYVVVTSPLELKEFGLKQQVTDTSRYFQAYQSIDNIRKSLIGISNSGTFQKMEHMTNMESDTNSSNSDAIRKNALRMRQEFCDLVNFYYDLDISVEEVEVEDEVLVAPEGSQTKQLEGKE